MSDDVIPVGGLVIQESARFAPGTYLLDEPIRVSGTGITVRGVGVTLIASRSLPCLLQVTGAHAVELADLSLIGGYHGVRVENSEDVALRRLRVRDTAEIAGIDTFLDLWLPVENAYGGALLLNNVRDAKIEDCDLQHQQNGVLLYHCSAAVITGTNASFNSGWGIYLSASHQCLLRDNRCDFCNRVYRRPEDGSTRAEADSAGIVLVKGSSQNRVLGNSCIGGGDGIFVVGYQHPGIVEPCSGNLFEDNDCRLSPNNAIESTFSSGNTFRRNHCGESNYGFWLGYSWDNVLEDNIVARNRFVGIALEHGHDVTLRNNHIHHNAEGVRLWTRGGEVVRYWPGHEVTRHVTMTGNRIESNGIGVSAYTGAEPSDRRCGGFDLRANRFSDNRVGVRFRRVEACRLESNDFEAHETAVELTSDAGVALDANRFDRNRVDIVRTT